MNTKKFSRLAVLIALLAFAGATNAFVGTIAIGLGEMNEAGAIQTPFSADAKIETEGKSVNTTIYYKPGKLRDEINMDGQEIVTIRRFDLGTVWMVMPQNMYMEFEPDANNEQVQQFKLIERNIDGQEVVNGIQTTKYSSVYEGKDGKFVGSAWFTDDNIAVKAIMVHETKGDKQRVMFEMTDLRRGDQADTLFEIPAGYQKFDMGNFASMQNMGAMGSAASEQDDSSFGEEVTDAAQEGAEEAALEETKNTAKEQTKKVLRGLFGK